jgi:2-keto-4-pentenoate hydratase/2-oxohepta-3-ene-1,7-dioic acid hydratase in catechol pathway
MLPLHTATPHCRQAGVAATDEESFEMRVVTYEREGVARPGVVVDERVLDVQALASRAGVAPVASVRGLLEAGRDAWSAYEGAARAAAAAGEGEPLDAVTLRAPIEDPDKIICLGLNYRDHADEAGLALPAAPMVFAKYRNSLTGPAAPIVLPAVSRAVDYEAELAVVIGRVAKDVEAADALDHVAGVMAVNDVTARDVQHATSQWTAGKAIDTFAPCGPALVLLDEIDDIQALRVSARVNGVTVQDGTTADMIFAVGETIAFLSKLMTLVPGDIVATGTPAGVGFSRDPQVLLRDGDVVEVEIEGVGTLRNPVVAADATTAGTASDQREVVAR